MTNTDIAPAGQQTPAKSEKPAKPRRIPPRIQKAIRLISSGQCKSIRAAAERVGMNYGHLSEQLRKPHIQAFAEQKARENIQRGVWQAAHAYPRLVNAESEHVAAKVSERLLEHGGIIKPQSGGVNVNINNNIAAGYVIDLSRGGNQPSPADAAQVIDNIESERK